MKVLKNRFLIVGLLLLLFSTTVLAKDIVIEFIAVGGAQEEIMDEMVAAFEAENPGIRVETPDWPAGDAYTKYVTRIKAGDPPDCGRVFFTDLEEFKERGALVPLDDYVPQLLKEDFYEGLWNRVSLADGQVYAIPGWFSSRLFMYRKDLLDEHGLAIPETPEELLHMVKALHNPPEMYGFAFPGKSTRHIFRWFSTQLWGRGGEFFAPDMKSVAFNSEAGLEALTFLNELKEYFQPGYLQEDEHDVERLYYMGKTPVTQMMYRVLTNSMQQNSDWEIVADFPPTPEKVALGIMDVFCVFKTTPERQAASWKWLEFIQRPEYMVPSNLERGFQPLTQTVADEFVQDPIVVKYPAIKQFIEATDYARFEPVHPGWNEIEDALGQAIQACFLGQLTPQQALDQAAKEANAILEDYAE